MSAEASTIEAPGCTLTYDVRGDLTSDVPLFLLSSPLDAAGFATLARHFDDRPVVTYDPRGVGRSPRTDDADENLVTEHADDLRRVIEALGVDEVDIFASSGGAVNALALLENGMPQVRVLVAHEPPIAATLPDRAAVLRTVEVLRDTYLRDGLNSTFTWFLDLVSRSGPLPDDYDRRPITGAPPFELPPDDGTRRDPMLGLNMRSCASFEPDLHALRATSARLVVAYGVESADQLAGRSARGLAAALDLPATEFPSHHDGFLGGEFGQMGQPDAFAARLRHILDTSTITLKETS